MERDEIMQRAYQLSKERKPELWKDYEYDVKMRLYRLPQLREATEHQRGIVRRAESMMLAAELHLKTIEADERSAKWLKEYYDKAVAEYRWEEHILKTCIEAEYKHVEAIFTKQRLEWLPIQQPPPPSPVGEYHASGRDYYTVDADRLSFPHMSETDIDTVLGSIGYDYFPEIAAESDIPLTNWDMVRDSLEPVFDDTCDDYLCEGTRNLFPNTALAVNIWDDPLGMQR